MKTPPRSTPHRPLPLIPQPVISEAFAGCRYFGTFGDEQGRLPLAADINGQAISLGWSLVSDSVTVTTPTLRLPPPAPLPRRLRLCSHHCDLHRLISYLDSFALLFTFHADTPTPTPTQNTHTRALSSLHARTSPLRRWPSNPVFHRFFFSSLLHSRHATSHRIFPSMSPPPTL